VELFKTCAEKGHLKKLIADAKEKRIAKNKAKKEAEEKK
jgi:hypothetical protein